MAAQQYSTIKVESDGTRATLTLNRPDHMNSLDGQMNVDLYSALKALSAEPDLQVLVLTGAGRAFCAGGDLRGMAEASGPKEPARTDFFHISTMLHQMPAVTIAAINGACAGGGLSFAAACDLRYASPNAKFNTAFLNVALAGDYGLNWTLPRIVGPARARDLLFNPRKFTADQALEFGLVSAVVDEGDLLGTVHALAERISSFAPRATRTMKTQIVAGEQMTFADYIELEGANQIRLMAESDPVGALLKARDGGGA
jgi:2-(1,2-epoxy-1,2-dihydrophenyl)acetyl-CoA isomerase